MTSLVLAANRARRGIGQIAVGLSVLFAGIAAVPAQEFFDVPVRINMGGPETQDSYGRTWLGDREDCADPQNSDPLNLRPNDDGGEEASACASSNRGGGSPAREGRNVTNVLARASTIICGNIRERGKIVYVTYAQARLSRFALSKRKTTIAILQ